MASAASKYVSVEEYLLIEEGADDMHEYYDGQIVAMEGASFIHNYIVGNIYSYLHVFLEDKGCDVFASDLRIITPLFSSYIYPDVSIFCGELQTREKYFDTATNPTVIIEVMSSSTIDRDLGFKFWYYLQIPTVKEYIVVDTTKYSVRSIMKQDHNNFKVSYFQGITSAL